MIFFHGFLKKFNKKHVLILETSYGVNSLFVSLIIYSTVLFSVRKTYNMVFIGSFLCGMALTNQHTVILLEVPLILWVFYVTKLYQNGKDFNKTFMCFVGGLSCYITLPIFAKFYPHKGSWGDVTSVQGFFDHIRRKDYGSTQLYSGIIFLMPIYICS